MLESDKKKNEKPGVISLLTLNGKLIPKKNYIALVTPADTYWKRGYRSNRYVFVQRQPGKMVYEMTRVKELFWMVVASLNVLT